MGLGFSKENWKEVLKSLGFTEQRNPNGYECYDIYDNHGTPKWQYEKDGVTSKQEMLYYFFSGMVFARIHDWKSK